MPLCSLVCCAPDCWCGVLVMLLPEFDGRPRKDPTYTVTCLPINKGRLIGSVCRIALFRCYYALCWTRKKHELLHSKDAVLRAVVSHRAREWEIQIDARKRPTRKGGKNSV